MARTEPCPCASGRPYEACCEPFHKGAREAPEPQLLMRSRYSAFSLGLAEYLYRTLDEAHEDRARSYEEVIVELRKASRTYRYPGVTILATEEADRDGVARVLFFARVYEKGQDRSFLERSSFLFDGRGWRYLEGEGLTAAKLPKGTDPAKLTLEGFTSALRAAAQRKK